MLDVFETDATYKNPNRRITGRPYNTQFGYNALGYFTADDFNPDGTLKAGIATQKFNSKLYPGDIRYEDVSGPDGKPDGGAITYLRMFSLRMFSLFEKINKITFNQLPPEVILIADLKNMMQKNI